VFFIMKKKVIRKRKSAEFSHLHFLFVFVISFVLFSLLFLIIFSLAPEKPRVARLFSNLRSGGVPLTGNVVYISDPALKGYWNFDDGTTKDLSGSGNNGTVRGSAFLDPAGKFSFAYTFYTSSGDRIDLGSPDILDDLNNTGMTISAWIYPYTNGAGAFSEGQIVNKNNIATTTNGAWAFYIGGASGLQFQKSFSTAVLNRRSSNVLTFNNWTYVVVTWDGSSNASNIHIYVNGVETTYLTTTDGAGNPVSDAALNLCISDCNSNREFNGSIDEVAIFNRVLSSAEVQDIYQNGLSTNSSQAVCGNSIVELGETCDDGNTINTDACTNVCANAICGDNAIRTGIETCDDGNTVNGDGCSSSCLLETGSLECTDSIDNDGDSLIDLNDLNCAYENDNNESGTVYYACDCEPGADPQCVAGNDANAGASISSPWRTYAKAVTTFNNVMNAGDTIAFCKGGVISHSNADEIRWVNPRCLADNRCVVRDYIPNWASGDENKPVIKSIDGVNGFNLEDGANADHEEGYVFRNLEIIGNGTGQRGFFIYNDIDDVLFDNLIIRSFRLGIDLEGFNTPNPGSDGYSDRIILRNSIIRDNVGQGWLGSCDNCIIENNYFENNGFGFPGSILNRNHNLYYSSTRESYNSIIRNNFLYKSAVDSNSVCQGVPLVVHGNHTNLLIENNTIIEDIGKAGGGCWGIVADQGGSTDQFLGLIIRGNKVINVGNLGIGCTSCENALIENNVIVQEQNNFDGTIISIPSKSIGDFSPGDAPTFNVTVRHNSIFVNSSRAFTAIGLGDDSQFLSPNSSAIGNNIQFVNNSAGNYCLRIGAPYSFYNMIDYNLCNISGNLWARDNGTQRSLSSWVSSSGFDANSLVGDAGFKNSANYDLSLLSNSQAINKVPVLFCPSKDILGISRPQGSMCDIGAYEYQGATQCNDSIDNDGDSLIDWQYDLGCVGVDDTTEGGIPSGSLDNGWTVFEKSVDTRIVYVSSSEGDDTWSGLASGWNGTDGPRKTLRAAVNLVRNGSSDWMLLKRGDVWMNESLWVTSTIQIWEKDNKIGRSPDQPIIFASYGNSTKRPLLKTGNQTGFWAWGTENIAILGLEIYADERDTNTPIYTSPAGVWLLYDNKNILIEDNYIHMYDTDIIAQSSTGKNASQITIRRNVITDAYNINNNHAQGIFTSEVYGLVIEGNVFDHNGWRDNTPGGEPSMFNHNIYLNEGKNTLVKNNVFLRASSIGNKIASDKTLGHENLTIENNFYQAGEIGISLGGVDVVYPSYRDVAVRGNVFMYVGEDSPTNRSLAWYITGKSIDGLNITNNYMLDQEKWNNAFALRLIREINNLQIKDNVIYNLKGTGFIFDAQGNNWTNISILNNQVQDNLYPYSLIQHTGPSIGITYFGNQYFSSTVSTNWFKVNGLTIDFANWTAFSGEINGKAEKIIYPDPSRNLVSYQASLGKEATRDAFIAEAKQQSKFNWRQEYTAGAVNNYIRAGFELKSKPTLIVTEPRSKEYKNVPVILNYAAAGADNCWIELDGVRSNKLCTMNGILNITLPALNTTDQHSLTVFANNSYGNDNKTIQFNVTRTRRLLVKYNEFAGIGETTNIDSLGDNELENLSLTLDDGLNGKIKFIDLVNITLDANETLNETDIDSNVNISQGRIEVNSANLRSLNKKAQLTFRNINFNTPKVKRDGADCTDCAVESYTAGNLIVNVSGFSVYSVEETLIVEPPITPGGGGGGGGGPGTPPRNATRNVTQNGTKAVPGENKTQEEAEIPSGEGEEEQPQVIENVKKNGWKIIIALVVLLMTLGVVIWFVWWHQRQEMKKVAEEFREQFEG